MERLLYLPSNGSTKRGYRDHLLATAAAIAAEVNPFINPFIGCAGWSIPKESNDEFPNVGAGTHLTRYAQRLAAVEINSSFYRAHRPDTYRRWSESVPEHFRFAVKVPRQITHLRRLVESAELLDAFLSEVAPLGSKLGPLLVQLPPGLPFDAGVATDFFTVLREHFSGSVVCEPRHPSWFTRSSGGEADLLLIDFHIGRVAADPAPVPEAANPGGWDGLVYYRLHGSPRIYYSDYAEKGQAFLESLTLRLTASAARGTPTWCIFDNTARGAATANALATERALARLHGTG